MTKKELNKFKEQQKHVFNIVNKLFYEKSNIVLQQLNIITRFIEQDGNLIKYYIFSISNIDETSQTGFIPFIKIKFYIDPKNYQNKVQILDIAYKPSKNNTFYSIQRDIINSLFDFIKEVNRKL